jgi:hypothetical protein
MSSSLDIELIAFEHGRWRAMLELLLLLLLEGVAAGVSSSSSAGDALVETLDEGHAFFDFLQQMLNRSA